jgi:phosphate transport system protein
MTITRSQFEDELEKLRNMLLAMGSEADRAIAQAMRALTERDVAIAEQVIFADDVIDEMDLQIEAECMRIIALQHPLARDLRLVGTALKIITDLERIGDHAVDIAKVARKLANQTDHHELADLPRMAAPVRRMIRMALDAFVRHDLTLIEQVVNSDDEVDDLFHSIRTELHEAMQKDPAVVVEASYLLFVAHYLERVADHAVNIAERVYFVETAELSQLAKSHKRGS